MASLLILYPELFKSYSKFKRHVKKYTDNPDAPKNFKVFFLNDSNFYIKNIAVDLSNLSVGRKVDSIDEIEFDYAIIFDDGECFEKEVNFLKQSAIKYRFIKILITRVINIHKEPELHSSKKSPTYEYIGRGSYWGNPHSMYENGESREEVIRKYKYDFDNDKFPNKSKTEVTKLAGKKLGCFCKPAACHGDVLADYLNSLDDGN